MKKLCTTIIAGIFACTLFAQTTLTTATDFTVTDVTGTQFNLFNMLAQGKHVCIDFFFTTCGPCQATSPYFKQTYQNYGCNTGDIYFISIDYGDNNSQCIDYELNYLGGTAGYPVVSGMEGSGSGVCSAYGINAYPTYILIAPNHNIIEQDMWPITGAANFTTYFTAHGLNQMLCATGIPAITQNQSSVTLFPNPTTETLNVTSQKRLDSYKIYNTIGKLVGEGILEGKAKNGFSVNLKSFDKGVYFIQMVLEKTQQTLSFTRL